MSTSYRNGTDWRLDALCVGEDPELWFSRDKDDMAKARELCRRCSARLECLNWALRSGVPEGIYGGETGRRRKALRAKLGIRVERFDSWLPPEAHIRAQRDVS